MAPIALLSFLLCALLNISAQAQDLPSVYDYYAKGGVSSGLEALSSGFKLNGKDITLQSGAIHYFRVHPKYWRDRLRKLRATGLIAVETYVPWNLHEPEKDKFDFGDDNRDFSEFLDIASFLKIAQEEDLLVLLRPGPYICAEWDMGGIPSWLVNIPGIKMRTSEKQYLDRVTAYFNQLLPIAQQHLFVNNGSIIAVQLENEYSSVGYSEGPDQEYIRALKSLMESNKINALLFTSDNSLNDKASIPEALRTINFQNNVQGNLNHLVSVQPNKPPMVMEFWTGWFDHWMKPSDRLGFSPAAYGKNLEDIMKFPAAFNLYMFHGGTSFGFLNGANTDHGKSDSTFDVTSYDYFAPLSEPGDYTEKYNITADLVSKYQPIKFKRVDRPPESVKKAYAKAATQDYISLSDLINYTGSPISSPNVVNMESLNINGGSGQSFGYVWYRKTGLNMTKGNVIKISGYIHDMAQVFVDGKMQTKVLQSNDDINGFGFWRVGNGELTLNDGGSTLDIIVENMGRINYGINVYDEKKGLFEGPVLLNGREITDWQIVPLEFKRDWIKSLSSATWKKFDVQPGSVAPGLYRTSLTVPNDSEPADTFLDSDGWTKGVVFVNGFNLGRYNKLGPQKRLYLPAPLLQKGSNEIIIFEQFSPAAGVSSSAEPSLG